ESGELQEILEERGLAFVGSGSAASRAGMNKDHAKRLWARAGIPTAAHELVAAPADVNPSVDRIGLPCVIKPIDSGNRIDVFICKTPADARQRCHEVLERHGAVMVEKFISGIEITVGILEERPLSPIRITTSREFFDYQAKYVGNDAQHHFDLNLPATVVSQIKEIARRAHETLGCRDLSRVDLIVDQQMRLYVLEINTMPGFTPKSLLPEMAAHDGIPFSRLVDRLVCRAYARGSGRIIRQAV
ncbi:MAG TPA: ATP-grasp domain-containing protein, partial [Tepidisphaeraceae bacterium]|nr:ATP-grasp domain-containing protein [Tepidisphaeraceae bacterium]